MTDRDAAIKDISAALDDYFSGIFEGDTDRLERVFLPEASLFSSSDGPLQVIPIAEYLDLVRGRPSPAATGAKRTDRILSIDIAAPEMALAKVTLSVPPKSFTDFLTLLKVDGRWRIAAKAFTYQMMD